MQIIDGKLVASKTREQLKIQVQELSEKATDRKIGLAVILVGDDPASQVYVRNKIKACDEVGIKSFLCKLPAESTFDEVAGTIRYLNENPDVSGMILQLPLPKHLDENSLLDLIDPEKDVDGCHYVQKGRLWYRDPFRNRESECCACSYRADTERKSGLYHQLGLCGRSEPGAGAW